MLLIGMWGRDTRTAMLLLTFTAMDCKGHLHCFAHIAHIALLTLRTVMGTHTAMQCSPPCFAWLQSALLCPPIDVHLLPAAAQNGPVFDQCSDVRSALKSTCSDWRKHLDVVVKCIPLHKSW